MSSDFPPLTVSQQLKLDRFAGRLEHHPRAVIDYLVMLRRLMILAGIRQRGLATGVAAVEPTPPAGQTRFGHNLDGEFVEQRASDELRARDRLPRPSVDQVVAMLYAESRRDRSAAEVATTLHELRKRAERAAEVHRQQRAKQGYEAGTRQPTYDDLKQARIQGEAEATRIKDEAAKHLVHLGIRYEKIAVSLEARNVTLELLFERTGSLQNELGKLKKSLGHAAQLLKAQTVDLGEVAADRDEGHRRERVLRMEVDQLAARVASLQHELAQLQVVREDHPDFSSLQLSAANELAETSSRAHGGSLDSDTYMPRHALREPVAPAPASYVRIRPKPSVPVRGVLRDEDGPLRTTLRVAGMFATIAAAFTVFMGFVLGGTNSAVLAVAGDIPTRTNYGVDQACGKQECVPVETVNAISWELNSARSFVSTTFGLRKDRSTSGTPLDGVEGRLRITDVWNCAEAAVSWKTSADGVVVGEGVVTSTQLVEELSPRPLPVGVTQVNLTLASVDPQCTTSVAWEKPALDVDGFLPFN